jgi:hypothetical protein
MSRAIIALLLLVHFLPRDPRSSPTRRFHVTHSLIADAQSLPPPSSTSVVTPNASTSLWPTKVPPTKVPSYQTEVRNARGNATAKSSRWGQRGFLCETGWSAPSPNNSAQACLSSTDHMLNTWFFTVERAVPATFAALCIVACAVLFLVFPVFIVCRYGCHLCGSPKRRPGHGCCDRSPSVWDAKPAHVVDLAYPTGAVLCVKVAAMVVCLLTVLSFIMTMAGGLLCMRLYDTAFQNAFGVLTWAQNKTQYVEQILTIEDAKGNATLVPPLSEQSFADLYLKVEGFRGMLAAVKAEYDPYVRTASIIAIVVASVPMSCILTTAILACCSIRHQAVTLVNAFLHVFFALFYGVLGGILLVFSIIFIDIAGERERFLFNEAGLISWSLIPLLDSKGYFDAVVQQVDEAETTAAIAGCEGLSAVATNATGVWLSGSPTVFFSMEHHRPRGAVPASLWAPARRRLDAHFAPLPGVLHRLGERECGGADRELHAGAVCEGVQRFHACDVDGLALFWAAPDGCAAQKRAGFLAPAAAATVRTPARLRRQQQLRVWR